MWYLLIQCLSVGLWSFSAWPIHWNFIKEKYGIEYKLSGFANSICQASWAENTQPCFNSGKGGVNRKWHRNILVKQQHGMSVSSPVGKYEALSNTAPQSFRNVHLLNSARLSFVVIEMNNASYCCYRTEQCFQGHYSNIFQF